MSGFFFLVMAICVAIAFFGVLIAQRIDYKVMCKKYGKEEADEIMKRWI